MPVMIAMICKFQPFVLNDIGEKMNIRIAKQSGVGLVEVMVALLVFSVGMLGVASLQVVSKKSSFEAQQRLEATWLANDLAARISGSGMSLDDQKTYYSDFIYSVDDGITVPTSCNEIGSECDLDQIVAWDKYQWKRAISAAAVTHDGAKQGLLSAKGCVTFGNSGGEVVVAWLSMSDIGDGQQKGCDIADAGGRLRHIDPVAIPPSIN